MKLSKRKNKKGREEITIKLNTIEASLIAIQLQELIDLDESLPDEKRINYSFINEFSKDLQTTTFQELNQQL